MRTTRLLFLVGAACAAIASCTDDEAAPVDGSADAGMDRSSPRRDARSNEEPDEEPDASETDSDVDVEPPDDAGEDVRPRRDANGPGAAGEECFFNRDCQLALRCECDGPDCSCARGARGTGRNGIDPCDGGNQCASSLSVEETCSDECVDHTECTGKLPRCIHIGADGICSPP